MTNKYERFLRRPKIFIMWLESGKALDTVLINFANTVIECPDLILPGYYHPTSHFIYVLNDSKVVDANQTRLLDTLYRDEKVQKHEQLVPLKVNSTSSKATMHKYDFFNKEVITTNAWKNGMPIKTVGSYFTEFSMKVIDGVVALTRHIAN